MRVRIEPSSASSSSDLPSHAEDLFLAHNYDQHQRGDFTPSEPRSSSLQKDISSCLSLVPITLGYHNSTDFSPIVSTSSLSIHKRGTPTTKETHTKAHPVQEQSQSINHNNNQHSIHKSTWHAPSHSGHPPPARARALAPPPAAASSSPAPPRSTTSASPPRRCAGTGLRRLRRQQQQHDLDLDPDPGPTPPHAACASTSSATALHDRRRTATSSRSAMASGYN